MVKQGDIIKERFYMFTENNPSCRCSTVKWNMQGKAITCIRNWANYREVRFLIEKIITRSYKVVEQLPKDLLDKVVGVVFSEIEILPEDD